MASPVVYFVRRGHLPNTRVLLFAAAALWGCGSRAPGVVSSHPQTPHQVSQAQIQARTPGVAIRLPAKGGTPMLYRLPRLTAVEGVLKGKSPAVPLARGPRFPWPQAPTAIPRDLFGGADQHLLGVIPQDKLLAAAANQPATI